VTQILISYCHSQIFELCHTSEVYVKICLIHDFYCYYCQHQHKKWGSIQVKSVLHPLCLSRPLSFVDRNVREACNTSALQPEGLNVKQERSVWFASAFTGNDRWTRRVMSTKLKLWHDGLCTLCCLGKERIW
jgi:hypothetical protein